VPKRTATKAAGRRKVPEPQLVEMGPQKVATITTKGDPNKMGSRVMPALYGSVYMLKSQRKKAGKDFKVGASRARWPDSDRVSKAEWTGIWALPVPEDTIEIPQKIPEIPVELQTWEYGTVAQIVHVGSYRTEAKTIDKLRKFIEENGYEIAGVHEEEYLTRPTAKVQKTLIRYPVKKKV
jgi:effector-binding domain-containing protein